jgi:hypothetical protein
MMLAWSLPWSLMATHIVGGDLRYRCLGNDRYEIALHLRRDCLNGSPGAQFDQPASVGIFDRQGRLQAHLGNAGRLLMSFRRDDTLNELIFKNCGIAGGDVCVHATTYVDTLVLPQSPGGYVLSYQRCCRNYTIRNIEDPLSAGATYTVEISDAALAGCNSSPELGPYPPIYLCGDYPVDFDLRAKDAEGDSLVYRLCTPYLGANTTIPRPDPPSGPPYDLVRFIVPYQLDDLIGGTPSLAMDPSSGRLTGYTTPEVAQYLVAYCVEEYRDGELLSVSRRDFQVNVRLCLSVPEAGFLVDRVDCSRPLRIQCTNTSSDRFSNIVSSLWTVVHNGATQRAFSAHPEFEFPDTGWVSLSLIVRSAAGCSDTLVQTFQLSDGKPEFYFRSDTICLGDSTELVKTYDPAFQYRWEPSDGLSCVICPQPKAGPSRSTRYYVHRSDGQCTGTDTVDVFVQTCYIDRCAALIETRCLPGGMVEVTAVDAGTGLPLVPALRNTELFWDVKTSPRHPTYAVQQQNPLLLFDGDSFSLTVKRYFWKAGLPKTIEFADICTHRVSQTLKLDCTGPCDEFNFVLSSCHDDYDRAWDLNYPASLCETICGGACTYIVALFDANGQLVDPTLYDIRWSTGSRDSWVRLMGPYHNTLRVEVRKGDCIWRGRYWKACENYPGSGNIVIRDRVPPGDCGQNLQQSWLVTSPDGRVVQTGTFRPESLAPGIYWVHVSGAKYKQTFVYIAD